MNAVARDAPCPCCGIDTRWQAAENTSGPTAYIIPCPSLNLDQLRAEARGIAQRVATSVLGRWIA